ncbi:MAG: precorrin-8X methylmutase [Pseudomonadota bacterium]
MNYERDPAQIYAQSFATVRAEADLARFDAQTAGLAVRLIHACGMVDVAETLQVSPGAVASGRTALAAGGTVLCDCTAVESMVIRRALPPAASVLCTLNDDRVPALAAAEGTTRSAAAVTLWRERLAGAVVAIGNAPTALFRLLEGLDAGWPRPALILGFPVGFVGAAESKAALAQDPRGVAYATLSGRRGGSAMAAAAVNALGVSESASAEAAQARPVPETAP